MREINKIIVHCSGTPEFKEFDVNDIRTWHVDGNGWSDVGYHYIVKLDGVIENGRPESKIGAHVKGNNRDSIGLCYIGGMNRDMTKWLDTRTDKQKEALLQILKDLKQKYPGAIIYGHKDFTKKKLCPSFDAKKEYQYISNEKKV